MQTLTINARALESAHGFMSALTSFKAELVDADDGSYLVRVTMSRGDREIIAILNALEDYVSRRAEGPTEVGLAGRTYKLHPTDPPQQGLKASSPVTAA
jgi:hypothetical protein